MTHYSIVLTIRHSHIRLAEMDVTVVDRRTEMALKIRLRRMGRRNAPTYRIVVAESSMPRDGRIIESIGHYNPRTEPLTLAVDRGKALHWMERGATPTATTLALLKRAGVFRPEETVLEAAAAAVTEGAKSAASKVAGAAKGAAGKAAAAAKDVAEEVRETAEGAVEAVTGEGEGAAEASGNGSAAPAAVAEGTAEGAGEEPAQPAAEGSEPAPEAAAEEEEPKG